ncbi:uncharacterized protein RCC_04838 [Ramularia collo-cygni]|uniref:Uncharacterized protein n=1 Tax=Ramularia collo-cygni TaxID=112498 RepID=A0A2D3VED8_9PEZI|nr:uncharacterized protein RCC_04838 [Ramularia collo-cygni]CZT18993.1 uncharacterized protein RCC_04838 [Ramularia collo-cygni]
MPALSPTALAGTLMSRADAGLNSTGVNVVCAWPLSSQYGPGSRVLYYVLVAACVFARKADWLRNACVGLALLVPMIAALHGVVLAAVHVPGAVDMDVYGAFQLCAIGVLAAPVAVRQSSTYFNDPGRNTIFVWVLVLLSGLVSLTVEFYRVESTRCERDDSNNLIESISSFPYDNLSRTRCGLDHCSPDRGQGPFSPIRGGSADNIYIIPAPDKLTSNTAMLLAAACCIPAILLLVSMWFKILESIWKSSSQDDESNSEHGEVADEARTVINTTRSSLQREKPDDSECFEIHNAEAGERQTVRTAAKPNRVAFAIREYGEIVVFGSAVLAILVLGERNMFSSQIQYQQEPIGNIGQWSPIAGTILAILGSAYLLLAEAMDEEKQHPNGTGITRSIARLFMRFGDGFRNIAQKLFDDSEFRRGRATGYPEVPGEAIRNAGLSDTISIYSPSVRRDSNESGHSALSRQRSGTIDSSRTRTSMAKRRDTNESPVAKRRDTLEVPASPGHHGSLQGSLSRCVSETMPIITRTESPGTPSIIVSPSPVYRPDQIPKSRRHTMESNMRYERPGPSTLEPG